MNIIFLVADLHLWGGGERVTCLLANHLASHGKDVTILSVATPGTEHLFAIDPLIHVEYLNVKLNTGFKLIRKPKSLLSLWRYFKTYKEPTILLGIGNYPTLLVAMLPRKPHIKTVGCQHNSYASVRYGWKLLRSLFFSRLNALVSLTNRDVPRLKRHNKNVWVIPNPVTFYPEQPAALDNKIILSVGRLDYLKGYDLMLDVFERFCKVDKEWKLRIIGDGPLKAVLEKSILDKGLLYRVAIIQATSHIQKEYLESSIFLMTSRSEGLPMVLLEAQSCGLPVVAFNCETGPAEIIAHGKNGYLVEPNNVKVMSEKLLELSSNFQIRKSFGLYSRESVRRFMPDEIYKKWELLFDDLP